MNTNLKKEKLREVWLKKIKENNIHIFKSAPDELKNDKKFIKDLIYSGQTPILMYASDKIKSNIDFLLQCVDVDSTVLKYASEKLKSDTNFVLRCLEKHPAAFEHVSNELKNKDFILYIIKKNNCNMRKIFNNANWIYDDYDITLAMIQTQSRYFNFRKISKRLRSDKTFILEAMKISTNFLYYASKKLKDDEELALLAVSNNYDTLSYISNRLKNNKAFILLAIENNNNLYSNKSILKFVSKILCNDFDVVFKAVSKFSSEIFHASKELRHNEIIIKATFESAKRLKIHNIFGNIPFGCILPERLLSNFDIMLNVILVCSNNIKYISDELKNNEIFINAVVDSDLCRCFIYHRSIYEILLINKQLILKMISKFKNDVIFIPEKFRDDKDIILHFSRQIKLSMKEPPFSDYINNPVYNYIQVNDLPSIVYTINNVGCITNIAGTQVYAIIDSNMTFNELSKILYNIKNEYMSFINTDGEKITPFDGYKKITDVFTNVKI